ncbi:hypothetical protein [Bifidobacterium callitrichos]|uniref:hypothetical protein n=1 Tax=Bifidobacterium callitrichos TaxID=762209 RepID=UPI0011B26B62|nr:hypothetical protein [Bifidobacterium callitrichos]
MGAKGEKSIRRALHKRSRFFLKNIIPVLLIFCLSVPQAIGFIANIGPWTIPDYDMHVASTYALATGQVFPEMTVSTEDFGNDAKRPVISGDSRYLKNNGARNDLVSNIIDTPFQDDSLARQKFVSSSGGGG